MYYEDLSSTSGKVFECFRNGNFGTSFELHYRKTARPDDIIQEIERNLHLKRNRERNYRFFNQEGVEISIDEFDLLKNGDRLFVSEGEEFDQMSMLAEYKMSKQLGEGGFGKVMLAHHRKTGKKVAIKIVDISKFGNASDVDMIYSETETLKSLHHANIVKILHCFSMKDMKIAFVMEYLEGGELLEVVREKKQLPESLARTYFKQLIEAVGYCHRKRLIHRDLKLENILLVSKNSDTIKIVDFGIAGLSSTLKTDFEAGSLKYMPPEVLNGTIKAINPAIDIWALGCILYGMVCGQLPFNGSSNREIIRKICAGDFKFPTDLDTEISAEVKDLIKKILVVDPLKRSTLNNISTHPWVMGEKFKIEEKSSEKREEFKETRTFARDSKGSFSRPRSDSVKAPNLKGNHLAKKPVLLPIQMNNKKKGNLFIRADSGGVSEAMPNIPSSTKRNSIKLANPINAMTPVHANKRLPPILFKK